MIKDEVLYLSRNDLLRQCEKISVKDIQISHFNDELFTKILDSNLVIFKSKKGKFKILKARFFNTLNNKSLKEGNI
jgi:hypothetical protein